MGKYLGLTFLVLLMALAGCSKSVENKVSLIQKGMKKEEVLSLLGKPDATDARAVELGDTESLDKWYYNIGKFSKPVPRKLQGGFVFREAEGNIINICFIKNKVFELNSLLFAEDVYVSAFNIDKQKSKIDQFYVRDFKSAEAN
jgi:hypothetical protein